MPKSRTVCINYPKDGKIGFSRILHTAEQFWENTAVVLWINFPEGVNVIHIDSVIDLPPSLRSNWISGFRGQPSPGAGEKFPS